MESFRGGIGSAPRLRQPLRWGGREYDAETGLYFFRARYYDPELGRFLSEDPIGLAGGIDPYAFADDDPVNLRDPSGMDPYQCQAEGYNWQFFRAGSKGDLPFAIGYQVWGWDCQSANFFSDFDQQYLQSPGARQTLPMEQANSTGWGDALQRGWEWATGTGPAYRYYTEGSIEVAQLKHARIVDEARAFFYDKNLADTPVNGGVLESVTDYAGKFGAPDHFRALHNATEFFVGSARIDILVTRKNALLFIVSNATSFQSGFLRYPWSYERSEHKFFGNTRQVYWWIEPLDGQLGNLFPPR